MPEYAIVEAPSILGASQPFERPKLVGQKTSWFEKGDDRTM